MSSPFGKEARKAALEQAILKLREDKDRHQSTKKNLLIHASKLLAFNHQKNTEEKTNHPDEERMIEDFRRYLHEEILQKETPATRTLCNHAFQLQRILAKHWPVNNIDEETGQPEDPIFLEPIIDINEAVPLSSGHLILKRSLHGYYAQRRAYVYRNSRLCPRHPISPGIFLSQRELDALRRQGINIDIRSMRFIKFMSKVGYYVGHICLQLGFVLCISITAFLLHPAAPLVLTFTSGIITGMNTTYQAASGQKFKQFLWSFAYGALAADIFLCAGIISYSIVAALGTILSVSAATVAGTTSLMSIILPLFPVLPLLYGIAGEFTRPGFLNQFLNTVCMVGISTSLTTFSTFFGETARLLCRATSAIHQALYPESAHDGETRFSANAQIHHDLGVGQVAIASLNSNENLAHANTAPSPVIHSPLPIPVVAEEEHAKPALSP